MLKIQGDEWGRLATLAIIFFMLFTCMIYGRSIRTSLFLTTFSINRLPSMYLVTYLVVVAISMAYASVAHRFDSRRLLVITSSIFGILFLFSKPFISYPSFVIFIFIAVEVQAIITIIQFWSIADDIYTVREGKRFFPMITMLGLASAGGAALSMRYVVKLIHAENIFFVNGALMLSAALVIFLTRKANRRERAVGTATHDGFSNYIHELKSGLQYIAGSSFLLSYTAMTAAIYLTNGVIEFQFAKAASSAITDLDSLTKYYGQVQGGATMLAFAAQSLLTGRLMTAIGVQSSVQIYPVAIFIAISFMCANFGIASATLAKITNDFFLYSIHDTVSNLMLNPVSERIRSRVRIFLQGTTRPLAAIVISILLIYTVGTMSPEAISVLSLIFVIAWFVASRFLAKDYIKILVTNLKEGEINLSKYSLESLSHIKSKESIEYLDAMLNDSDDKNRLLAAHLLCKVGTPYTLNKVARLVVDDSGEVKILALKSIRDLRKKEFMNDIFALLSHNDRSIRIAAMEAFAEMSDESITVLWNLLKDEKDIQNKIDMLPILVKKERRKKKREGDKLLNPDELVNKLISSADPDDRKLAVALIAELSLSERESDLTGLLNDRDETVVDCSLRALLKLEKGTAITSVVPLLKRSNFLLRALEAFKEYGSDSSPYINKYLASESPPRGALLTMLGLLGDIGTESSAPSIIRFLDSRDHEVRLAAYDALFRLQETHKMSFLTQKELLDLCRNELQDALNSLCIISTLEHEDDCRATLLFHNKKFAAQKNILLIIVKLFGMVEAAKALDESFHRCTKKTTDFALEIIDTLLPVDVRSDFSLVFGSHTIKDKAGLIMKKYGFENPDKLLMLTRSADSANDMERLCAIYDLGERRDDRFLQRFLDNMDHVGSEIQEASFLALSKLKKESLEGHLCALKSRDTYSVMLQRFGMA